MSKYLVVRIGVSFLRRLALKQDISQVGGTGQEQIALQSEKIAAQFHIIIICIWNPQADPKEPRGVLAGNGSLFQAAGYA